MKADTELWGLSLSSARADFACFHFRLLIHLHARSPLACGFSAGWRVHAFLFPTSVGYRLSALA
jgi:hypothetical protein